MKSFGIDPTRTAWKSPWKNGVAKRWIGSVRRKLLDHVVVFNEIHLRRLLAEYVAYCHDDRTHLGLGKATPASRLDQRRPDDKVKVVALPLVGGLNHRYSWGATAQPPTTTVKPARQRTAERRRALVVRIRAGRATVIQY